MSEFGAWRANLSSEGKPQLPQLTHIKLSDLMPGEITVEVKYSSVNYKDALAITGKGKILRKFPINAGIDAAGLVVESRSSEFKEGDEVVLTGSETGENFDGGYSGFLKTRASALVKKPEGLSLKESMILGTAGFTAALALHRMEQNGQTPDLGDILVTGASGGVGSFAVQMFHHAGYEVVALSGKNSVAPYLTELGAKKVLSPDELELGTRPLESVRFGGVVDNVGGDLLAKLLAHVQLWGNVGSIGLAAGAEFSSTVMPFILRGVSLIGISSNNCTYELRKHIWKKLASDWKPQNLNRILTRTIPLSDIGKTCEDLIQRRIHGRVLVDVKA